jgi:hypothetical protein
MLSRLLVPKNRIRSVRRKMISAAIKLSRDIYVEHMTGARQHDAVAVAGARRGSDGIGDAVTDGEDGAPIIGRREQTSVVPALPPSPLPLNTHTASESYH